MLLLTLLYQSLFCFSSRLEVNLLKWTRLQEGRTSYSYPGWDLSWGFLWFLYCCYCFQLWSLILSLMRLGESEETKLKEAKMFSISETIVICWLINRCLSYWEICINFSEIGINFFLHFFCSFLPHFHWENVQGRLGASSWGYSGEQIQLLVFSSS